jgi:branched-chain amino acid transport system substrate-binding protein
MMVGCFGSQPVIGVLLPMTGDIAAYGQSMKNAIDLAIADAEEDGTLPSNMKLVWGDSESNPETAVRELRRLVGDERANLIIAGTTSGSAKELLPVIDELNVVCISPSASAPALTKESRLFYRTFASDELEGRKAGDFLFKNMADRSVVIYTGESEHARGIEPMFRHMFEQAQQGKVVGKVVLTTQNWERESADLLNAHAPDSVYIIAYAERTLEVLRHLRERNFQGTICVTSAFHSGEVIEQNPDLVEGVFFPQPNFDTKNEKTLVKEFVAAFESKYGSPPDIYAAHAFDTMRVVMEIVRITPQFRTKEIKQSLSFGLKEFDGVTGIIQFDERGDVHHNPVMFVVVDGKVLNYDNWVEEQKIKIAKRIRAMYGTPTPTATPTP